MQFRSFGITRRVSRKTGREMSAHVESCELRTLLCAPVVSGGTVDSLEPQVDSNVDSFAGVAETDLIDVALINSEVFEIMSVEPAVHEEVFIFRLSDDLWISGPEEAMTFVVDDLNSPGDGDGPVDWPSGGPTDGPFDGQSEGPTDGPWDWPTDGPIDGQSEGPTDGPWDWPTDGPFDGQSEGSTDGRWDRPTDGPVDWPVEGPNGEKLLIAEDVCLNHAAPVEGWDPSWLYRTLTLADGDGNEEIIVDQGPDLALNDFDGDGDGVPDEIVLYAFDPLPLEDLQGVPVEDYYSGGAYEDSYYGGSYEEYYYKGSYEEYYYGDSYFEPVDAEVAVEADAPASAAFDPFPLEDFQGDPVEVIYFRDSYSETVGGEVAVEVDKPASDPTDEVVYLFDQVEVEDASGEPVDVVEDGELVPLRTLELSDFDPAVIFYSAAAGGVEVQRTNDNGGVHEETGVASTVAIPVRANASNSLFNADSGRSLVGIPVGLQTTSALGSNTSPAKRNTTQRRSSTQMAPTRPSVASEGLDSLTPLLGGETGPDENDSQESSAGSQEVESGSVEETVSDSGNASFGASGFAANQKFQVRNARTAMIDRVMALYAENSFNS